MIDENINKRFGDWTILRKDEEKTKKYGRLTYVCQCKCGTIQSIALHDLKVKRTTACRKCCFTGTNNSAFVDKSGMVIDRYSIISFSHSENQMSYWNCLDLYTGNTVVKSDHCLQNIKSKNRKKAEKLGLWCSPETFEVRPYKVPFVFKR